ncbi:MAG: hypothetical protein IK113_10215 [Bacteroidales bacterium]|nr:hypothetical protein [Bacteroidales bacterium]
MGALFLGGHAGEVEGQGGEGQAEEAVLLELEGQGLAVQGQGQGAIRIGHLHDGVAEEVAAQGHVLPLDIEGHHLAQGVLGKQHGAVQAHVLAPPVAGKEVQGGVSQGLRGGIDEGQFPTEEDVHLRPFEYVVPKDVDLGQQGPVQIDEPVLQDPGAGLRRLFAAHQGRGIGAVLIQGELQDEAVRFPVPVPRQSRLLPLGQGQGGDQQQGQGQQYCKQSIH